MTPKELLALWDRSVFLYRFGEFGAALRYYREDEALAFTLEASNLQSPFMVAWGF